MFRFRVRQSPWLWLSPSVAGASAPPTRSAGGLCHEFGGSKVLWVYWFRGFMI